MALALAPGPPGRGLAVQGGSGGVVPGGLESRGRGIAYHRVYGQTGRERTPLPPALPTTMELMEVGGDGGARGCERAGGLAGWRDGHPPPGGDGVPLAADGGLRSSLFIPPCAWAGPLRRDRLPAAPGKAPGVSGRSAGE